MKKKKAATLLFRRRFANMIESYAAIASIPNFDIKEYAKAAIRDIFIQMPSRSVTYENWPGFKNYIIGFFGENSYNTAMDELQTEGWLTKGKTRYEWKKMYSPVGAIPKKDDLNEWADSIISPELKKKLTYDDVGAYPFIFNIKKYDVKLGNQQRTHWDLSKENDLFKHKGVIAGRIWTKEKIISLWEYPDTKSMFNAMIKKINEKMSEYDMGNIDSSWKIDIPNVALNLSGMINNNLLRDIERVEKAKNFRDVYSYLVPVFEWNPQMMKNPKEYINAMQDKRNLHIMSPLEKYKLGLKTYAPGFGSEKRYTLDKSMTKKVGKGYALNDIPPFLKHQLSSTSEGKINEKYVPKLDDYVKVDGKWFIDKKERAGKIIWVSPNKSRVKIKCNLYPSIFTISTKNVKVLKNKLNEIQNNYGCLMLNVDFKGWENFIDSYINKKDLYDDDMHQYGIEREPHVTILYGFHDDTDINKIKEILNNIINNDINITTDKISIFKGDKFDVVKFDVKSQKLNKLNKIMKDNFNYTTDYKEYNPHMTIAYVKKGLGQKYIKNLKNKLVFSSDTFTYSYPNGEKEEFYIKKFDKL